MSSLGQFDQLNQVVAILIYLLLLAGFDLSFFQAVSVSILNSQFAVGSFASLLECA